ncbi:MAG: tRNA pseudouridine(55) synthase TruB [Breznakibacter sp.]
MENTNIPGHVGGYNFEEGEILLFDKPYDWTSFDLVNKVRCMLKYQLRKKHIKVGHAGTLDPLATGLMIVCTGKATKKIEQLSGLDKEYVASIELGAVTPTYDLESLVEHHKPYHHVTQQHVEQALDRFRGSIMQIPPVFSAIKIKGEKAYELARRGETVDLSPRPVRIHQLEIEAFDLPRVVLRIKCSKGTYIRSLAHDIGQAVGVGAHLTDLCRTQIGEFSLENALQIEKFERNLRPDATND